MRELANVNYQKELEKLIEQQQKEGKVPRLFLHACCAPCSSYVLEYLSRFFSVTVFFYNPNISPKEEYEKRVAEIRRLISEMEFLHPVSLVEGEYKPEDFYEMAKGLEDVPEGGERCFRCYRLRMEEAARLDTVLSFHEEDKTFIKQNGINHGKVSEQLGIYGSPALAEDSLVARDCMIALATGARIDIQHISSGHSVEMVRLAKKMGANVWAEVTPHHFTLTEDAVLEHGTLAKMNPPLRTEWDRQMLIEGLKDGTIDMIATDHAPHSKEEKEKPITEAPSGITGLETSLALGITSLVKPGHLTLMGLMEKMSLNPAKLYKLDCGRLEEGAAADLVIFDENEKWVVDGFASKATNSPFLGAELTGRVKYTICDGKVVYRQ